MRAGTFLHSGLYYKLLIYVLMNILSTLEPLLQPQRPPIQRALEGRQASMYSWGGTFLLLIYVLTNILSPLEPLLQSQRPLI